jgi:hypothetical protein
VTENAGEYFGRQCFTDGYFRSSIPTDLLKGLSSNGYSRPFQKEREDDTYCCSTLQHAKSPSSLKAGHLRAARASLAVHSGTTGIMENEGYHERCILVPTADLLEEMYRAKLIPQISEDSDGEFDPEDLQEEGRMKLYPDEVAHWARNN